MKTLSFSRPSGQGRNLLRAATLGSALLLFTACGGGNGSDSAKADGDKPGPGGKNGADKKVEAVPVQTAAVTRGPIAETLTFNSTLETESTVDLFPRVAGQVQELLVEEGDFVKTGDPLLKIDDREWRVDANEAQVNLQRESANFARSESLYERNLINEQDYQNAKFMLEQMKLRLDRAQIRLDHATVRAPFDGVVSDRQVQVGARVSTGNKLFSLVSLQDMVARVFVPGRYLPDVAKGQAATVTSDFLPDRSFQGWVKRISPVIDPQSGTFKVTVGISNPDLDVLPGLFVKAAIVTEEREAALLVPKRAVVYDGGNKFLFTVRDDKAVRLPLEAGFESPDTIEVRSGLEEGDPVIVLGQSGLKDDSPVKIVNPDDPDDPAPVAEIADTSAPEADES